MKYTNSKKVDWWLRVREGRGGTPLYYFTTKQPKSSKDRMLELPKDRRVIETKTGMPLLKKIKRRK